MKEFKYDIALSFANEDREYAKSIANRLRDLNLSVFYDEFEKDFLWGRDLYSHISNIYKNSLFTVVVISRNYSRKLWPSQELKSAEEGLFNREIEKILPIRIDDAEIVSFSDTIGYLDAKNLSTSEIADLIALKVAKKLESNTKKSIESKISKTKDVSGKGESGHKRKLPICLYTVQTKLAFKINEKYYNNIHYVWCSDHFDISKKKNPRSSDPIAIYNEIKNDTLTRDQHSSKIDSNKVGIIKGARIKYDQGVISSEDLDDIVSIVNSTPISDFIPLVYVIPTKGIEHLIEEAPISQKANPFSREYIIKSLNRDMFDIINIDDEYFAEE